MALTQSDRIAISKKIVGIPLSNASADRTSDELEKAKAEFEPQDVANASLISDQNILINAYQLELNRYDGNARNELVEQDFLDSINRVKNNPFFPNDPQLPLPGLPNGIWVNFIPFANTKAIGKQFDATYAVTTKEQDLLDDILSAIATVESFSVQTRSTGQACLEPGSCSLPIYDNEVDCEANSGTWTPSMGPDEIDDLPAMQAAGVALIDAVQAWEDFINGTYAVIPTTDTEPTRASQNDDSRSDITNTIAQIDTWQALQTYDITHGQTTCAGFNTFDVNTLNQTKFRSDSILILTNEITARIAFIVLRSGQINTDLGTVVQNTSTGSISSVTGFYGTRFRFIDLRLNAIAGSLTRLKGIERGQEAQGKLKEANDNAEIAYDAIMKAVSFRSPGTNTKSIHLLNTADFSVGNAVYIVSDTQNEISATIESIDGNRIVLDKVIPEKYRHNEYARLYKVL